MSFIDDVSSPMNIHATLRHVRCRVCDDVFKLSHERLGKALDENSFTCSNCAGKDYEQQPSRTKSKASKHL